MGKFPEPLALPNEVRQARQERHRQLFFSSTIGISLRSFIILLELFFALMVGSSALFMDALTSILDVITSFILLLSIRFASRPPDSNHPFGHGRFEPLAGLQMGVLFIIVGAGMFIQQTFSVVNLPEDRVINPYLWIIALIATVLMETCYRILMKSADKFHSPALAADAAHYRVDSLSSLFAMAALLIGAFLPSWSHLFDHLGAMAIAGFMIVVGFIASKENFHQLLDHIPSNRYFNDVKKAAKSVEGVLGTEKIRIQLYGPDAHVDIDIEVDPKLSVEEGHKISQHVRLAIQKEWPAVQDVTVHIEPFYPNDH